MCLQRESPFRVLFDEVYGLRQNLTVLVGVARIAGLHKAVVCHQLAIIFYFVFTIEDHFQLVIMPRQWFGVRYESIFGGECRPVYVFGKRMSAVGLYAYKFSIVMEKFY